MATAATRSIGTLSRDDPSEDDEFGAHAAIATAIRKLIDNSASGFGIALVGEPGSGKSTVLELLRSQCDHAEGCGIAVFRFDAWAHQGDNLRRAFLDELADFLEKKWEVDPKKVRGSLSPTSSQSTERLTLPASFGALALFLLLTPNSVLRSGLGIAIPSWAQICAFWISFVGLLISAVWKMVKSRGVLSLLARAETVSATSPTPTSIEFRRLFRDLVSRADLVARKRVLVIALEDFDRLPEREREEAWSVMRTYTEALSKATRDEKRWAEAIWTIVPLQARSTAPPEDPVDFGGQLPNPADRVPNQVAGRIDRLCQIRFVVPPPYVTAWRKYLADRLKAQLPGWKDTQWEDAISVYSSRLARAPLWRTPRHLRAYANELVAINALETGGRRATPDVVIQLAANILESDGSVDPLVLVKSVQADSRAHVGKIASLLYNREPNEAIQAVFDGPVLDALLSGNSARLSELERQCSPALMVAQTLVERGVDAWALREPKLIGNVALALSLKPEVLEGAAGRMLKDGALKVAVWQRLDEQAATGLGWLCLAQKDSARQIFESVARTADSPPTPDEFEHFCTAVNKMALAAEDALPASLSIGRKPESFLNFMQTLHAKVPDAPLSRFRPACGDGELVSNLKSAPRDETWVESVTCAALAGFEMSWLVPVAKKELTSAPTDNSLARAAALAAVVMLAGGPIETADQALHLVEAMRSDGRIFTLLAIASGHAIIEHALILGALMSKPLTESYLGTPSAAGVGRFRAVISKGRGVEWDAIARQAGEAGAKDVLKRQLGYSGLDSMQRELIEHILHFGN